MAYQIDCKFCNEKGDRTKQHVISRSLGGTVTYDMCSNCQHQELNRQIEMIHNQGTFPITLNVGKKEFIPIKGNISCGLGTVEVPFLPKAPLSHFLEINGRAEDFRRKEYPMLLVQNGGYHFYLSGGSLDGQVSIAAIFSPGTVWC